MASRPKDSEPIVPVCAAIIVKGDRVLVGRRKEGSPEGGKWEFPGGKPMAGEDLRACLRRELDEELGVIAEIGDLYDVVNHRYEQRNVLLILFRADISEVAIRSGEHDLVTWAGADELRTLDFLDADRPIVRRLIRELGDE
jgi:8-oxo-dGTP diphosphatase